ncbi:MAG: hypothetical protein IKA41_01685 [Bacteroidaceae bacterium]|nr:hypothetical protein [Bacteroidaceae bacterium]
MNVIETVFRIAGIVLCIAVVLMNVGIIALFLYLPTPLYLKVVATVLLGVIGAVVATNVPALYKPIKNIKKK